MQGQRYPWGWVAFVLGGEVLAIVATGLADRRPRFAVTIYIGLVLIAALSISIRRLGSQPRVHPAVPLAAVGVGSIWFWIPISVHRTAPNGFEVNTLGDAVLQQPLRASSFAVYGSVLILSALTATITWCRVRSRSLLSRADPV
ncbi:MAG TPA: hypothetical protein VGR13_00630 [Actinomycetota bacterium]|nr:hypothetical protein [Actinomycetota bacterium]